MIRYDGYYTCDPLPYKDGNARYREEGYFHNAYLFLSNGTYLKAVKKTKPEQVSFSEADFNPDFPNKYEVKDNEVIITFETGTEWEFIEVYMIINSTILKCKDKTLHFFSW